METFYSDDVQAFANWISSNPDVNTNIFLEYINEYIPLTCKHNRRSNDLYFYKPDDNVVHALCIVIPNSYELTPEDKIKDWSHPYNFSLPTVFSEESFIEQLRSLNLLDVNSIKRGHKLKKIL